MDEMVTVIMLCYNHGKWIKKALDGVINQKTNFKYCAIVHDDASKDNSQEIIREYAQKYPNIIKPVLQSTNQYSKGAGITVQHIFPKITGKYVAFCECDDYWIDETKLQKQIEYMENHPDCTLCFSNSYRVDTNDKLLSSFFPVGLWKDYGINKKIKSGKEEDFSVQEMLLLDFIPTASVVIQYSVFQKQIEEFQRAFDIINRIYATSLGYAHYFPEKFSVYRIGNPSSAAGRAESNFLTLKKNYYERHKECLEKFDKITNYKYQEIIKREEERKLLQCYLTFGMFQEAKLLSVYKDLLISRKLKNYFYHYCGGIYSVIRMMLQKFRRIIHQKDIC